MVKEAVISFSALHNISKKDQSQLAENLTKAVLKAHEIGTDLRKISVPVATDLPELGKNCLLVIGGSSAVWGIGHVFK